MRERLTFFAALAVALGALVLYPLFSVGDWFWRMVGAVVVVALTGLVTRRLRVPALAAPIVAAVTLTAYLTFCFARRDALLGFVPTPDALAGLTALTGRGLRDINHYTAPVPALPGILLLTTLGVGVVAILVDLLAVRLRRAAAAGLPLLALYAVPVAVLEDDVGWVAFALGALGFLALLVADGRERVRRWGRPVLTRRTDDTTRAEPPDVASLAAAGRRIALAAVAVALVVPLVVPALRPTTLAVFGGLGGGHGGSTNTITIPDPTANLKGQISEPSAVTVLSYTSDDPTPEYLRIYALDIFTGDKWTMSRTTATRADRVNGRTLPTPDGLVNARYRTVHTAVHVADRMRNMRFLPVPYPPAKIDVPGDWRLDQRSFMVFSNRDSAGGRDYDVLGRHVVPSRTQLEMSRPVPGTPRAYVSLPPLPVSVQRLATRITRNRSTPYGKAMAIQDWFTTGNRFTYSLDRPAGNGTSALADFLFRNRTGYCEQFAAAMAVLARLNGIPARVAIGYTAGTRGMGNRWTVTTRDAHAWPELYFTGIGWIRFEPTPSGIAGQGTASVPDYAAANPVGGNDTSGTQPDTPGSTGDRGSQGDTATTGPAQPRMRDDWGGSAAPVRPAPADRRPVLLGLAAAVLLAAGTPWLLRSVRRRRRWARAGDDAGLARAAWLELRDDALDLGWPWRPSDTPRAAARRLAVRLGERASVLAAIERITRAEERARYARTPEPGGGLAADVRLVRRAMAAATPRTARWRARVLPGSTLAAIRRGAVRGLDVFAWLDLLGARTLGLLGRLRRRGRSPDAA